MTKPLYVLCSVCSVLASYPAHARLAPAAPFNDHCVLQRNRTVPVWGESDPGAEVTVAFAGQRKTATADGEGRWRIDLNPLQASCEGREMRILATTGEQTEEVVVKDILVGVVWLCGGQSNMTFMMWPDPAVSQHAGREMNGYFDLKLTDEPLVRGARMPALWSVEERGCKPIEWFPFTPASYDKARKFSAAAWHFAVCLNQALKIPVGVVEAGWGGTCIETWIPHEGYAASEHFKDLAVKPISTEGKPEWIHHQPRACWNAMLAPLAPYGFEGAIWYQGCTNRGNWRDYYELLTALRDGWSMRFETPDMPFFLCQLAPFGYYPFGKGREECDPGDVEIREEMERFGRSNGQRVGCAILSDVGEIDCIHPGDKRTVGVRLSALALNRLYGRKDLVCDAPVFEKAVLSDDGRRVTLSFSQIEGWCMKGTYAPRFELAGADGVWHQVDCDVQANVKTIGLIVPEGLEPCRVAYMRKSCVHGFLKNEAGLPLGPFRGKVEKASTKGTNR